MAFHTTLRSTGTGLVSAFHRAGSSEATVRRFFDDLCGRAAQHVNASTAGDADAMVVAWLHARDRRQLTLRTLRYDRVDPDALAAYVAYVRQALEHSLETAHSQDAIADVLESAADDLHSYLLAHEFVSADYLDAVRGTVAADISQSVWTDIVAGYDERPDDQAPARAPNKNDLAFAA